MRVYFFLFLFLSLSAVISTFGCGFDSKVIRKLDNALPYKGNEKLLFISDSGVVDTLFLCGYEITENNSRRVKTLYSSLLNPKGNTSNKTHILFNYITKEGTMGIGTNFNLREYNWLFHSQVELDEVTPVEINYQTRKYNLIPFKNQYLGNSDIDLVYWETAKGFWGFKLKNGSITRIIELKIDR